MQSIEFIDLEYISYTKAWNLQKKYFAQVSELKKTNPKQISQRVLFCEHPHVYTLGKSGEKSNLLITDQVLKSIDAEFIKIDRGGDITYHGPGQLVGYPIFDLDAFNIGIKDYVYNIEEVMIRTVATFGLQASRLDGAPGVWLDANKSTARKIAAIGIKASRGVTMHGFALNINTQLEYFGYINPCGFTDKGATSLSKELKTAISIDEVKLIVKQQFEQVFGIQKQNSNMQVVKAEIHHGKNMETNTGR